MTTWNISGGIYSGGKNVENQDREEDEYFFSFLFFCRESQAMRLRRKVSRVKKKGRDPA